jgi:hypothetical protein
LASVDTWRRLADRSNEARVPEFEPDTDLVPIVVPTWNPPVEQLMMIVDRVASAGFARVRAGHAPTRRDLLTLADLLCLDTPIDGRNSAGDRISATRWRSDGTFQRLGDVRTSFVLCPQAAVPGRAVRLFNATGAFVELACREPRAAAALLAPDVLVRTATAGSASTTGTGQGRPVSSAGPAFGIVDGHLLTRYGRSDSDQWRPPVDAPEPVWRALDILDELAAPPSRYHLEFTMAAGECLILSTARICFSGSGLERELFAEDLVIAGR